MTNPIDIINQVNSYLNTDWLLQHRLVTTGIGKKGGVIYRSICVLNTAQCWWHGVSCDKSEVVEVISASFKNVNFQDLTLTLSQRELKHFSNFLFHLNRKFELSLNFKSCEDLNALIKNIERIEYNSSPTIPVSLPMNDTKQLPKLVDGSTWDRENGATQNQSDLPQPVNLHAEDNKSDVTQHETRLKKRECMSSEGHNKLNIQETCLNSSSTISVPMHSRKPVDSADVSSARDRENGATQNQSDLPQPVNLHAGDKKSDATQHKTRLTKQECINKYSSYFRGSPPMCLENKQVLAGLFLHLSEQQDKSLYFESSQNVTRYYNYQVFSVVNNTSVNMEAEEMVTAFNDYNVLALRRSQNEILILGCGDNVKHRSVYLSCLIKHEQVDTLDIDIFNNPSCVARWGDDGQIKALTCNRDKYKIICDEGPVCVFLHKDHQLDCFFSSVRQILAPNGFIALPLFGLPSQQVFKEIKENIPLDFIEVGRGKIPRELYEKFNKNNFKAYSFFQFKPVCG